MIEKLKKFWSCDMGQDLIEYSLVMALIALVTVGLIHARITGIWAAHPKFSHTSAS